MEMAILPDEVRRPSAHSKEFHHDTWHWINIVHTPADNKFRKPDEILND